MVILFGPLYINIFILFCHYIFLTCHCIVCQSKRKKKVYSHFEAICLFGTLKFNKYYIIYKLIQYIMTNNRNKMKKLRKQLESLVKLRAEVNYVHYILKSILVDIMENDNSKNIHKKKCYGKAACSSMGLPKTI